MAMIESRRLYIIIRVLIILLNQYSKKVESFTETSDLYLRNVVNELQRLNEIDSFSDGTRFNQLHNTSAYYVESPIVDRQIASMPKYNAPITQMNTRKPNYLKDPGLRDSMVLGFTPDELADMYRKAVDQGSALNYNAFLNVVNKQQLPLTASHASFNPSYADDPQYNYYFYPLESFRHKLNNYHRRPPGYDNKYESTSVTNNKKEMSSMHPILSGITSFIGMALFFIFSAVVYPRLMYYFHFPFVSTSRAAFNDLEQMESFVADSINHYNQRKSYHLPLTKATKKKI